MNPNSLVYPMFALVVLTAVVLVVLFRSRVGAVKAGKLGSKYFRVYQGEVEPEETAKPARHFSNLFEAPTLFYAACLAAMLTQNSGIIVQCLAWAYVAARAVHAYVHLGGNRLGKRMRAYFFGWAVLLILWVDVVAHVAIRA